MGKRELITSWAWAASGIGQYEGPHLFSKNIREICQKPVDDITESEAAILDSALGFLSEIALNMHPEGSPIPEDVRDAMASEKPEFIEYRRGGFNQNHVREYMISNAAMFRSLCQKLDITPSKLQDVYEMGEKINPNRRQWIEQNWTPESRP